jgi:hypothetical protein
LSYYIGFDGRTGQVRARVPYSLRNAVGRIVSQGITNSDGMTARAYLATDEELFAHIGDGHWHVFADTDGGPTPDEAATTSLGSNGEAP